MSEISTLEISMISSGMSRYCTCGTKIIRRTLWTDLNPGRGFDACDKNWWVDNETFPGGKQVVPGLLRRLRAMEEEGRAKEEQLRSVEEKKKELQ
ncbi:unnamed protein product [Prunus armeniaca]|uniref:Uncharacterized protein n=1 Tax=Prunus armeniaca TaxID=36596 RepID=A0A6J5V5B9_PRUAR|nr:unnamed protein product [Prunus armeniaca]